MDKAPYQGPDPYNAWEKCEKLKSNIEREFTKNMNELIKAEDVIKIAQEFCHNRNQETFDALSVAIDAYNRVE